MLSYVPYFVNCFVIDYLYFFHLYVIMLKKHSLLLKSITHMGGNKMKYNRDLFIEGLEKVSVHLNNHPLPSWEELPEFELYMDQVIVLLGQYLKIYAIDSEDDKFITASMINNYVKLKIMPAPVKKKYNKIHLAYLIIICSLKQTLSMAIIQKIIPFDLEEDEVINIYKNFAVNQKKVLKFTVEQVDTIARPIAKESEDNPSRIHDLVLQLAMFSNITKYLTEKTVDMQENPKE